MDHISFGGNNRSRSGLDNTLFKEMVYINRINNNHLKFHNNYFT